MAHVSNPFTTNYRDKDVYNVPQMILRATVSQFMIVGNVILRQIGAKAI